MTMVCFWAGAEFAPQGAWTVDTWKDDTWKEDTCTNFVLDRAPGKFFSVAQQSLNFFSLQLQAL